MFTKINQIVLSDVSSGQFIGQLDLTNLPITFVLQCVMKLLIKCRFNEKTKFQKLIHATYSGNRMVIEFKSQEVNGHYRRNHETSIKEATVGAGFFEEIPIRADSF